MVLKRCNADVQVYLHNKRPVDGSAAIVLDTEGRLLAEQDLGLSPELKK